MPTPTPWGFHFAQSCLFCLGLASIPALCKQQVWTGHGGISAAPGAQLTPPGKPCLESTQVCRRFPNPESRPFPRGGPQWMVLDSQPLSKAWAYSEGLRGLHRGVVRQSLITLKGGVTLIVTELSGTTREPEGLLHVETCPGGSGLSTVLPLSTPLFLFCSPKQCFRVASGGGVVVAGGIALDFSALGPGSPSWPQHPKPSRITARDSYARGSPPIINSSLS